MSPLRQKMIREMQLQRMSAYTVKAYILAVEQLARHFGRSPADLSKREVREFIYHLIVQRKLATSTVNGSFALSASDLSDLSSQSFCRYGARQRQRTWSIRLPKSLFGWWHRPYENPNGTVGGSRIYRRT